MPIFLFGLVLGGGGTLWLSNKTEKVFKWAAILAGIYLLWKWKKT